MSMLLKKQSGFVLTGMARLAIILFILTMAFALVDTIWAVYLDNFVKSASVVGFISSFLTLVSFFSFFFTIPLIEKSKKTKLFSISLLLIFISYILFAINTKFYFMILLSVFITILHTLRITSFGILIKEKSSKSQLSRNEGLMYTFMNIAWLLGPLLAGFLSEKYGINLIFVLAAIFVFVSFFIFRISSIKDPGIKEKAQGNIFKNFIDFFRDRQRVLAYFIGGGVSFWWSLIYLFVPIYMVENGLHMKWIGYFLFAVAIPLIFFSYSFSKLAGKIGFRKVFRIGFFIPFFFCLLCFFTPNIYLILLFLVLASFGLAMLEAPAEAYFFDILKPKEELRFYGPYNTTIDVNHFVGRIFSAVLLIFLPFKYVFLFFSLAMFIFFLVSFRVKNIVEKTNYKQRMESIAESVEE